MRITTQMLANTAAKSGIPLQKTSLLDYVNDSKSSGLFSGMNGINSNNSTSAANILKKNNYTKQEEQAEQLMKTTSKLADTGKDSLVVKAEESGSTKEVVSDISKMVEEYNTIFKQLQKTGDTMSSFYAQQLKQIPAGSKEALKNIGITQEKDGTLSVDEKMLESADLDTLKKAVNGESGFASKLNYISEHIADNASKNLATTSSQYTSNGSSYIDDFEANKYNFFG